MRPLEERKKETYSDLLEDKQVKRWFDNLSRGSLITARVYLRRLGAFCKRNKTTPRALLDESAKELKNLLLDLVSDLSKEKKAGSYIQSNVKAVKSWLTFNEIEIKGKIKIEGSQDTPTLKEERVPTKEELKKIFMSGDNKQRVACVLISHSGLRPESMGDYTGVDGLNVSDLPEMEIKDGSVSFKHIPSMVKVRSNLSKAGHQYFSFLSEEGCAYVKDYLEERMRQGEKVDKDSSIITGKKQNRKRPHVASTNIGDMIRVAIRKAGFTWRPYVLRDYFDSQLFIAENNGKIAKDYRAFFMGHKGDIEAVYTTNKGKLSPEMEEDMRQAFKRASEYLVTEKSETKGESELKRLFLLASGKFSKQEIDQKHLAELPYDELQKVLQERLDAVAERLPKIKEGSVNLRNELS